MKTNITQKLAGVSIHEYSDRNLHIMDFQERTNSVRSIEISNNAFAGDAYLLLHDTQPLHIINDEMKDVAFAILPCNIFQKGTKNTEGCLFVEQENSFALFVEIKDCKPKNISNYFHCAKQQIFDTVNQFRAKGLIHSKQKVYAVVSYPRRTKVSFDKQLFSSDINTKADFLTNKIIIAGTNKVKVINDTMIEHIL